MKIGPQWFTVSNTTGIAGIFQQSPQGGMLGPVFVPGIGVSLTYQMNGVTVTMTSLPVDARGAYNKTFQVVQTYSALTAVAIDGSIDPTCITNPTTASWALLGTLSTPTYQLFHSGNVRGFRARITAISSSDSLGVVFMYDDAG